MMASDEIAALRLMVAERAPRIIGVDGMNGVGKSGRVAQSLGPSVISLDDYLLGDGRYLDGFRLDGLRAAIAARPEGPVVIEGCCLLAVMEKVGEWPDLHVYVRRVSAAGRWEDDEIGMGDDRDHAMDVAHSVAIAAQAIAGAASVHQSQLDIDLINYHADFQPFQRADIVVDLVERLPG